MKEIIQFIQVWLNDHLTNVGQVDGLAGQKTMLGIGMLLARKSPRSIEWTQERRVMAALQVILNEINQEGDLQLSKLLVDGYYGPDTEYVLEVAVHYKRTGKRKRDWRKKLDELQFSNTKNPHGWPVADEESMKEYYGEPGDTSMHMMIDVPYPLRIAWNPSQHTQKMTVNKRIADSVYRCLDKVLSTYGREDVRKLGLDLFGGCYNLRNKRGGSTLSTHAFAAATDWDPARNRLKMKADEAELAKSIYEPWWEIWEEEGWVSLGRELNYDWMHMQATA